MVSVQSISYQIKPAELVTAVMVSAQTITGEMVSTETITAKIILTMNVSTGLPLCGDSTMSGLGETPQITHVLFMIPM